MHPKSFVYDTRHQARLGVRSSALNKRQMSGLNVSVFAVVVHPTARNHVSESHNKDGMVAVEEDIKDSDEELSTSRSSVSCDTIHDGDSTQGDRTEAGTKSITRQ